MARQIDLGDISKLAEDELEELVIFAAKVWTKEVIEKTPVSNYTQAEIDSMPEFFKVDGETVPLGRALRERTTGGILRGNWRQVKISKTRIEIQNNLPYAEPVVYGNNLPPSWRGVYRTRQNPPTIPGYPDILGKEIAAFQIPARIELIRRRNR
jgi:hypothetical protein